MAFIGTESIEIKFNIPQLTNDKRQGTQINYTTGPKLYSYKVAELEL